MLLMSSSIASILFFSVDPLEKDDIAAKNPDVVDLIVKKLSDEFASYVAKDVPPNDAKADPINFNSTWSPGWC